MPEDLETRINNLIKFSKGTMPVGILVADKAEAERAIALLAQKRKGKIVSVYVHQDGYDIKFQPD